MYAFPNHVQSIAFTTGGQSRCRNISKMIKRNGRHLSYISRVITKSLNTFFNVIFTFFLFNKFAKMSVFILSLWGIECRLMREKKYLNDFSIKLQHIKMWKKVKGSEYFLNALYMHYCALLTNKIDYTSIFSLEEMYTTSDTFNYSSLSFHELCNFVPFKSMGCWMQHNMANLLLSIFSYIHISQKIYFFPICDVWNYFVSLN